jgi:hypothetical protein
MDPKVEARIRHLETQHQYIQNQLDQCIVETSEDKQFCQLLCRSFGAEQAMLLDALVHHPENPLHAEYVQIEFDIQRQEAEPTSLTFSNHAYLLRKLEQIRDGVQSNFGTSSTLQVENILDRNWSFVRRICDDVTKRRMNKK